jgi:glutamate racemase
MSSAAPIGIFDSGIGGLSVARAIRKELPNEHLLYFADQAHLPYGERSLEEVRGFSVAIAQALLNAGSKLIVVACNTASAAALKHLRERFPGMRFVGMESAVKPAAEHTNTGAVGVLATTATFQGELFASVVERFAQGVRVIQQPCPGLVERIEAGDLDGPETERLLRGWLGPMLAQRIDALALACTHYPFVRPLIERIVGTGVRVIDPAPAIARQVRRLLEGAEQAAPDTGSGRIDAFTSGDVEALTTLSRRSVVGLDRIAAASWVGGTLTLA